MSEREAKAPAFQYYPRDFLSDVNVALMSAQEIGAYWLLVSHCWLEHGLPADMADLALLARLPVRAFSAMWERRLKGCFTYDAERQRWQQPRLDRERAEQAERKKRRQVGANAKWAKEKRDAMQMQCSDRTAAMQCSASASASASSTATAVRSSPAAREGGDADGATKPPTPPKPDTDPRVKPVIDRYVERYRASQGTDYPGRYKAAGESIRKLPKSYTTEALVSLVDEFWDNPDPWVLGTAGARIEVWVQKLPALIAQRNGTARSSAPVRGPTAADVWQTALDLKEAGE